MGEKKQDKLDQKITDLRKQQEEIKNLFFRIQGRIEQLEEIKGENDEKTDYGNN